MSTIGFLEITASFFAVIIAVYSTAFVMTQAENAAISKEIEDVRDDSVLLEEIEMPTSIEKVEFSGFEEYIDTDTAVDDTDFDAFLPQDKEVMVIEEIQDNFSSEESPSETVDSFFNEKDKSNVETLNESLSIQQEEKHLKYYKRNHPGGTKEKKRN